ncbi:ABC transporter ATP-binding protein [Vibrio crassostreae]|uniref:ABC transporter ATP-binding protein n=1 Tax=Vibrio crassostreae TaxID=246167 RepID=UPI00104818FA|nr:ABC transporter ATP-binding protein [Vibrio crassostreae]TCW16981.1 lipopolysaccharide transport system ATP-binding protein [Vibrio crassostreae]CAK3664444.1 lipopolysaccharide transport system ATP-binding protein [Vibrio crassostreae]
MGNIFVNNVHKSYKAYPKKYSRLLEWTIPNCKPKHTLSHVLKGINFNVRSGEAVGIIGINGAGKSTLLKMITGTVAPSEGSVQITGKVAALLELGMGFHPDFTGRENVYMAGQLIGLTSEEITQLMPDIEEFAEIGAYIDEPVRVYSSGMQVRLAFSVATAVRPDVLIIDEALSVGDAYFQAKSFSRIKEFKTRGTTLLLVSHDQAAIANVCDRAILLEKGALVADGKPTDVMNLYTAKQSKTSETAEISQSAEGTTESGNRKAIIKDFKIENSVGEELETVSVQEEVTFKFTIDRKSDLNNLTLGFHIRDRLGNVIFGTNNQCFSVNIDGSGLMSVEYSFKANIGVGDYSVSAALHKGDDHYSESYHWKDGLGMFSVVNPKNIKFVGSSFLETRCQIND